RAPGARPGPGRALAEGAGGGRPRRPPAAAQASRHGSPAGCQPRAGTLIFAVPCAVRAHSRALPDTRHNPCVRADTSARIRAGRNGPRRMADDADTTGPRSGTEAAPGSPEPSDKPKVLVVEDDADIRNILHIFLREKGFQVKVDD